MLAKSPTKVSVQVQCPACLGGGIVEVHAEERRVCPGCFGSGSLECRVEDEIEDALWEEALAMLDLVGVEKDPEAYHFAWRNGRWVVVDFETKRNAKGSIQ